MRFLINDEIVNEVFHVDGNEAEALDDSYLELFEMIGRDTMLKLFTHFHKNKIGFLARFRQMLFS